MGKAKNIEEEFNAEMLGILEREPSIGLNSARFRQMVQQYGGLGAAHRLLDPARPLPANTFSYLRKEKRLDLALEHYVVMEKFRALFSDEERRIAEFRLTSES